MWSFQAYTLETGCNRMAMQNLDLEVKMTKQHLRPSWRQCHSETGTKQIFKSGMKPEKNPNQFREREFSYNLSCNNNHGEFVLLQPIKVWFVGHVGYGHIWNLVFSLPGKFCFWRIFAILRGNVSFRWIFWPLLKNNF